MPAPAITYADLLNALHNAPIGFSVKGFTLASRQPDSRYGYVATITKAGNTWTVYYMGSPTADFLGRVMLVLDDQGQPFWPAPWIDGWV